MIPAMISGTTRVLGKTQGYIGLPVRDAEMRDKATGTEVPTMTSAWEPTPDELARLNAGAKVEITIVGNSHPPIVVNVGITP